MYYMQKYVPVCFGVAIKCAVIHSLRSVRPYNEYDNNNNNNKRISRAPFHVKHAQLR